MNVAAAQEPVTLRLARERDEREIARLAARDCAPRPRGRVLLALAGGRPLAALSLDSGLMIADPFEATAALRELLLARAVQLAQLENCSAAGTVASAFASSSLSVCRSSALSSSSPAGGS